MSNDENLVSGLADCVHPLSGRAQDFDAVLQLVGDASCVLIGEATHGTHEFYRLRAQLTQRLISEKGFVAIAAEADWPDAYRVNRYVRGIGSDQDANSALADFRRFPAWMWRNSEVHAFVRWLRETNAQRSSSERVGSWCGRTTRTWGTRAPPRSGVKAS
jgi:erythromycin esterase-like protein